MENILTLAYLGDSVYELYIRSYLISQGLTKVNQLQKEAISYVSAKAQCFYVRNMLEDKFLTKEEEAIFYRGRNHKSHASPKNTDVATYKQATGLEAVIGYLYLQNNITRIEEIMNYIKGGPTCTDRKSVV